MRRYYAFFILVGVLIYFPSLFKGYKRDDISQIVHFSQVHSLENIPLFFNSGFAYVHNQINFLHFYFKPVMFFFFDLLYYLGSGSPTPFHLLQIIIYIANTLFLFAFFSKLWDRNLSFVLAFLFLLFPGNVEVASYISNLQDVLFFFFGIISLYLIQIKGYLKLKSFFVCIFLLLSLLSKETGIIFLFLIPLYSFLIENRYLKYSLIVSFVSGLIYLVIRFNAMHNITLYLLDNPSQHMTILERIPLSVSIIGFYIQELIFPTVKFNTYLLTGKIPILQSISYFLIDIIFIFVLIFMAFLLKKKEKNYRQFIFFVSWFIVGILFHSQLFFSLDILAATRWLYFPLAGFLGIMGTFGASYGYQRVFKNKMAVLFIAAFVCLYFFETIYTLIFID